jgi:hypothetical protein
MTAQLQTDTILFAMAVAIFAMIENTICFPGKILNK